MRQGRGTKRSKIRTPSPSPDSEEEEEEEHDPEFSSKIHEQFYIKRGNHTVIKGISYNLNYLIEQGFPEVSRMIQKQVWSEFCELSIPVNVVLVRKFYANMDVENDGRKLMSFYQNNNIVLSPAILKGFLASMGQKDVIPSGGYRIDYKGKGVEDLPNADQLDNFNNLFEPQFVNATPRLASHLTLQNRLLHHIVVHTIIPHEGSGTTLNHVHLCLLWCLTHYHPIDLSQVMFAHMVYSRKHSRHAYPYAMVLTRLIMEKYQTVTNEALVVECSKFDIRRLFKKDSAGHWIKKPSNSEKNAQSSSAPTNAPTSSEPTPLVNIGSSHASASQSYSMPSLDSTPPIPTFDHAHAHDEVMSSLNRINIQMQAMNTRIDGMENRVNDMSHRIGGLSNHIARENVTQRVMMESYGESNLRMYLNLENGARHMCNLLYNVNNRMYYMDNHLASHFHWEQPPRYENPIPEPDPPSYRQESSSHASPSHNPPYHSYESNNNNP